MTTDKMQHDEQFDLWQLLAALLLSLAILSITSLINQ